MGIGFGWTSLRGLVREQATRCGEGGSGFGAARQAIRDQRRRAEARGFWDRTEADGKSCWKRRKTAAWKTPSVLGCTGRLGDEPRACKGGSGSALR